MNSSTISRTIQDLRNKEFKAEGLKNLLESGSELGFSTSEISDMTLEYWDLLEDIENLKGTLEVLIQG